MNESGKFGTDGRVPTCDEVVVVDGNDGDDDALGFTRLEHGVTVMTTTSLTMQWYIRVPGTGFHICVVPAFYIVVHALEQLISNVSF